MKPDNFEQKISQQSARQIPSEWRKEILSAAENVVPTLHSPPVTRRWLATLLWPAPRAWAGLAAVWVLILAVNFASRDETPVTQAKRATPPSPEVRLVLKQQQQLRAELVGLLESRDANRETISLPRPRSERLDPFAFA